MADNKTPLRIDLVKNSNQKSDYFGHYYGRVVRVATLSTRAFAQHIADHGSIYTLDIVTGVLRKLTDCLIEQLAEGKGVKLDGGADQLIEGIHVRFTPEGTELDDITSKAMKKRSALQLRNVVEITKTTVAGKVKRSHTYTPIEEASDPVTP